MISKDLLDILVCPENHMRVRLADADLIESLNSAIHDERLINRGGGKVTSPIEGGLVREDGLVLYPVVDGIPVMLVDESIELGRNPGE
jgi:uncharacterized protein YbaR (Trm112 family)